MFTLHLIRMNSQLIFETIFWLPLSIFRKRRYLNFKRKCSETDNPPFHYIEGSWVNKKISRDQVRIAEYLDTKSLLDKSVLHVGVGSSAIAKAFSSKVKYIDGVTIVNEEFVYAKSLNLPNYQLFQYNKYGSRILELPRRYDYIIDNNLSSYACCITHFAQLLTQYLQLLKPNGQLITDTQGLRHYTTGFGLTTTEFKQWESTLSLHITQLNEYTLIVKRRD